MASPTTAGSPAMTMRLPTTTHRTICPCLLNGGVPDRFQSTSPARHIINWQCEGASGSSSYSSRRDKPYNVSSKTTLAFSSYSRYWRWHAILSRCQIREEHISNGEEIGGDDKKNDPSDRRPPAQRLVGAIITLFATAKEWLHSQLTVVSSYWLRNWRKMLLAFGFGCVLGIFCICNQLAANKAPKMLPYSQLVESLEMGIVKNVLFEEGSHNIFFNVMPESQEVESDHHDEKLESGNGLESEAGKLSARAQEKLKKVFRGSPAPWKYSTRRIQNDEPYLLELIRSNKVEYSSAPRSLSATLGSALVTIITLWIPLSPLLWFMHKQLSTGSDSSKKRPNTVQLVKFHDVAGVDAAKAELVEIVSCLKGTSNFRSLGARLPKGVLLIGPPGTGKTLLARALAGEAGVPFFAASASEFVEMFVGRGAARIRDLFGKARKCSPSIIFIDELDAVGGRRGRSLNDERDQTLNQLLTEMDGFESESGVLVLAATNRPEALDPALCRPGRFSRRVYVKEPEWEGRCQVLAVHMRNIVTQEDQGTICKAIASITPGFVGADLANLVNEAALLAARRGQSAVTIEDFKEAVMRAKYGAGQTTNFRRSMEKKLCKLVAWAVPGSGQDLMDDNEADGLQMATNG